MPWKDSAMSASLSSVSAGGVAPQLAAHSLVEPLRKGFGQAIGDGRQQDGGVVVVIGLEGALASASPCPAVTAKAPTKSGTPESTGAT